MSVNCCVRFKVGRNGSFIDEEIRLMSVLGRYQPAVRVHLEK